MKTRAGWRRRQETNSSEMGKGLSIRGVRPSRSVRTKELPLKVIGSVHSSWKPLFLITNGTTFQDSNILSK